jgi:hypothetical protein
MSNGSSENVPLGASITISLITMVMGIGIGSMIMAHRFDDGYNAGRCEALGGHMFYGKSHAGASSGLRQCLKTMEEVK